MRQMKLSGLQRLILRRLTHVIPVGIGVSFITFAAVNLFPSTTIDGLLGGNYTKAGAQHLMAEFNFNQPFFVRYFHWLLNFLTGHWGTSYLNNLSVTTILSERIQVTVELALFAFILSIAFAVPLTIACVMRPRGVLDRLTTAFTMLGLATPQFVLGLLLIIVFSVHLRLLPSANFVPISQGFFESLRSLLLPAITLSVAPFSGYVRVLRADLLDQLQAEDYIMSARSHGLSRSAIVINHALRNSVFGTITVIAVNFSTLLGGVVAIEQIFSIPGMGQELLGAIIGHDVPVVLVFDTLIAVTVVLVSLAADLIYAVLDPRIRYERVDH